MEANEGFERRVRRLLRTESAVRRNLRVTVLLAVLLALWVFPHELGVFSDQPANIFGLGMWAAIIVSVYYWLRLRYVALLRWQSDRMGA
jgi:hypothetical protein